MPMPLRDSGNAPPITAPSAARPELPKNLRRLVSNLLPSAVLPPVSRAMTSLPCCPLPGFLGRAFHRKPNWDEYLRFAAVPQDGRGSRGCDPRNFRSALPPVTGKDREYPGACGNNPCRMLLTHQVIKLERIHAVCFGRAPGSERTSRSPGQVRRNRAWNKSRLTGTKRHDGLKPGRSSRPRTKHGVDQRG